MERVQASYQPDYDRFLLHSKNYVVQYNRTYLQRFNQMKEHLRYSSCIKLSQLSE